MRDASKEDLDRVKSDISEEDYQKALYVINENHRVKQFSEAIKNGDLKALGNLLYQSHEGLSTKYKVSCKELDFLVDRAKENPNVIGSRPFFCALGANYQSDLTRSVEERVLGYFALVAGLSVALDNLFICLPVSRSRIVFRRSSFFIISRGETLSHFSLHRRVFFLVVCILILF